jgi:Phosphoglucomutase/phosphomannomutase, alpha/beta/alpha domain I
MEGDLKRNETVSPMAGKTPPQEMLVDVTRLDREYFERLSDVEDPTQLVSFGTSGHRGSSLRGSFNEAHILAITQAICDYRRTQGTNGSLYMGKDTHTLPAFASALEVLAANGVDVMVDANNGYTPTRYSRTRFSTTIAVASANSQTASSSSSRSRPQKQIAIVLTIMGKDNEQEIALSHSPGGSVAGDTYLFFRLCGIAGIEGSQDPHRERAGDTE